MLKLHYKKPLPPNVLFGIHKSICGRKSPTDYRGLFVNDKIAQLALRKFFAKHRKDVTCYVCLRGLDSQH